MSTYRNDLDAAHARSLALERELAEAREHIAAIEENKGLAVRSESAALIHARSANANATKLLGAPTKLAFTRTLSGEVLASAFTRVVDHIKWSLDDTGHVANLPGRLSWTSAEVTQPGRPVLEIALETGEKKTTIRARANLNHVAGKTFAGLGISTTAALFAASAVINPLLIPLVVPVGVAGLYAGCRRWFRRRVARRAETIDQLLDELVEICGEHIEPVTDEER